MELSRACTCEITDTKVNTTAPLALWFTDLVKRSCLLNRLDWKLLTTPSPVTYETERVPMIATFDFDGREAKLTMRTRYSKVISVDTIKLVNPNCRVRQILNYARPEKDEDPLTEVVLAGFGMETKSTGSRLVGSIPS